MTWCLAGAMEFLDSRIRRMHILEERLVDRVQEGLSSREKRGGGGGGGDC